MQPLQNQSDLQRDPQSNMELLYEILGGSDSLSSEDAVILLAFRHNVFALRLLKELRSVVKQSSYDRMDPEFCQNVHRKIHLSPDAQSLLPLQLHDLQTHLHFRLQDGW